MENQASDLVDGGAEYASCHIDNGDHFAIGHTGRSNHSQHPGSLAVNLVGRGDDAEIVEKFVAGFFTNKQLNAVTLQTLVKQVQDSAFGHALAVAVASSTSGVASPIGAGLSVAS